MPVNSNINVPFIPQEGVTSQILQAMTLANEHWNQQQQLALQQQAQPSDINYKQALTAQAKANTALMQMQQTFRTGLVQALGGFSDNSVPTQSNANQVAGAAQNQGAPKSGVIGQVVSSMLQTPGLTDDEQTAIRSAGNIAFLHRFSANPENAMDTLQNTYNDIVKQHNQANMAIKGVVEPDDNSATGYSTVGRRDVDGQEQYRLPAPPPTPGSLDEATSVLARAQANFDRSPTDGNKRALDLAQTQKDTITQANLNQAKAEGEARAAIELRYAQGANPALAGVPAKMIAPASAAAEKAGEAYNQATQAGDDMQSMVDLARKGNAVSYSYIPVTGVLQINVAGQTKRINANEIEAYGNAGSAWDRVKGFIGKQTTGASIPANILDDMETVSHTYVQNAAKKYRSDLDTTNATYGSHFSVPETLGQMPKAEDTSQPAPPQRPQGVPANAVWNPSANQWQLQQ